MQCYVSTDLIANTQAAFQTGGKTLKDLNVAETATLAALPKGPERYNPRKFPGLIRS